MMPLTHVPESRLVTPEARALPLRSAALRTNACGGVARVVLEQTFANPYAEPLHVTYTLPLPADAAVSGFRFRIGDRVIEGEIDRRAAARERFEEAISRGHTAAILEQDRTSLFTQEIGNVPPGAEVVCEIVLDQKLRWIDEGAWEWRFPLAAAPRYLGEPGRVKDAKQIALDVAKTLPVRASLVMSVRDALTSGRSPESPSHPLSCVPEAGGFRVELGSGNAVALDRDVVVHWPVARMKVGTSVDVSGPRGILKNAHALVTIVPPHRDLHMPRVARDLTILLDTSGSMHGGPIEQAQRVASALIDGLEEIDSFELIEFSNEPRRFTTGTLPGSVVNRRAALAWIRNLQASGGTEMRAGILESLRPLRPGSQRQVILVTDGLIGFEQEIISEILRLLPGDARLHTVGVGSSVNRSLTGPAARAGRGVELVIGLGEDPERAATSLRARTESPLVVEVEISGSAVIESTPSRIPDLFAGAPVLACVRLRAEGGELVLRGKTANGAWEERVHVAASERDSGSLAIATLFGREAVEDAEMRLAGGSSADETNTSIERLGLTYRIATRLTSWVAVDGVPSVDPRDPSRRERVPQALPYGTSIEGFGLREVAETTRPQMHVLASYAAAPRSMAMPAPARGGSAGGGAPVDALNSPTAAAPPPQEQTRFHLQGRIVLRKGREIVIEIVLTQELDWYAEPVVLATLTSGRTIDGTFDAARTTRAGRLEAGVTLRITLVFSSDPGADAPTEVGITLPSGYVVILLAEKA